MTRTTDRRTYGRRFRAAGAALVSVLALAALVPASGASAANALLCDQSTVYAIGGSTPSGGTATNGVVKRIDLRTQTTTDVKTLPDADNALGIAEGGLKAYAFKNGGTALDVYDPATGGVTPVPNALPGGAAVIRGAVDPVSGIYYFATGGATITVFGYDPRTSEMIGQVAQISGLKAGSGDFAFSSSGDLYVVAQDQVLRLNGRLPSQAGTRTFTTTVIATLVDGRNSPGIAFSSDGYLYVASGTNLLKIDPATGRQAGVIPVTPSSGTTYAMTDLASCNYANTVSGIATVAERVRSTDQFVVTVTGGGIASGNSATSTGADSSVTAGPMLGVAGTTYTVTQTGSGTTDVREYDTSWVCTTSAGSVVGTPGTGDVATFEMPPSTTSRGTDVSCTFTNALRHATIGLATRLTGSRIDDVDQFAAAVNGRSATTTGSGSTVQGGDTGGIDVIVGRPAALTQSLAPGSASRYDQYAKTITCTDSTGGRTDLPSGQAYDGSASITPSPASTISCAVSAAAAPSSLRLVTTLNDQRFAAGDQFVAAIHDGDADAPAIGAPARAQTTGSDATVDQGTGTTTLSPTVAGRSYTLTDAATANGDRYVRTVSCEDTNGIQTSGLPHGSFGDGVAVEPVPGAQIVCTVGVVQKGSALHVITALRDPRFSGDDQFTVAITRNGAPVGDAARASTTGSGKQVDSGSGMVDVAPAARNTAHVISAAPTANAARYQQTVTCLDANDLQKPLPTDAAVSGSFTIAPEAGANLTCTITTAAKQAVVSFRTELGSDRFTDSDQFTAGIVDPAGVERGTASSETTTGTGSAVTPGTGTTGDAAVRPGLAYSLVGSAGPNAVRYDRTISCSDAGGLQGTGLPSGAYDGTATLTPKAGASVSCVVTATLKAAALTATAALDSTRYESGDQWTVAWRTGGTSGTAIAGPSSTTGSGSTIDPGTGVAGPVAAVHAAAYTLTDAVSGDGSRYASQLSCTDANGLQTGLPQHAAFSGSAVVIPEAGADVRCTITAALSSAALSVHLTGPASAPVGQPAAYTATLVNDGAAAATGAVRLAVPAGLAYSAVRGSGWSCTAAAGVVDCVGPDVAGRATSAFQVDLVPARGSEGPAVVRAAVDRAGSGAAVDPAACTGAGAPSAGCDAVTTVIGAAPHLAIAVTPPSSAAVGAPATWKVVVTDDGTGPAGGATVALRLPAGVGAVTADGARCTVTGQDAVCAVPGPIAAGASTAFTVTGTPAATAAGSSLVLRARLDPAGSASPGDAAACTASGTPAGCAVPAPVVVAAGVALAVAITPPTALTEGVPAGYAVAVANSGTGPAASPVVTVHLPDGLAYRGATGASCTASGGDLVCTLPGAVPAGGSTSFVVLTQPAPGTAGTSVAPTAAVDPAGTATPPACTTAAKGCAVADGRRIGRTGLVLTGTVQPVAPAGAQLAAGDRVRYAFTVTNRTGKALTGVAVAVPGLGEASCDTASLAPGASITCELGPVAVTQAQIDAGSVARDAVASGIPGGCAGTCGPARSNTVTLTAPVKAVARISAVQTVRLHDRNGDGVAQLGERVTFSVEVTNTGTVTLHGVELDDAGLRLSCPTTTLAVGESMVCTGTRTTTAEDVAAGGIRNVAIASARGVARLGTVSSQRTIGSVRADGPATALAHTGSNLPAGVLAGVVLLGLGGLLLVAGRRRRRTA